MRPTLRFVTFAGPNAYRFIRICVPSSLQIISATTIIGAMVKRSQALSTSGIQIFVHMDRIPLFCAEIFLAESGNPAYRRRWYHSYNFR